MAVPDHDLAHRLVKFLHTHGGNTNTRTYLCDLEAPALGPHYHLTTRNRKKEKS